MKLFNDLNGVAHFSPLRNASRLLITGYCLMPAQRLNLASFPAEDLELPAIHTRRKSHHASLIRSQRPLRVSITQNTGIVS